MAKKVEFIKSDKFNGIEYKKGETPSVSNSIYKILKESGSVKDFVKRESKPAGEK